MHRRTFLTGALAGTGLLVMGHSPYRQWSQYRALHTVVATDRSDARSFPLGERLARRLTSGRPDLNATAVRSQDARTLLSLLKTRQLDLALLRAEDAYQGLHGTGAYVSLMVPLRALTALAPEYLHIVVPSASPVRQISHLRGKSVAIADGGRWARAKAQRVIAAFGLNPDGDVRWEALAGDEAWSAVAAGRIAACFLESPLPAPALAGARRPSGLPLRLVPPGETVAALVARHGPIYFHAAVGPDHSSEIEGGGDVLGEARLLVCREDYPAEKARAIAKALADWQELAPPETPLPIPLHPSLATNPDTPD